MYLKAIEIIGFKSFADKVRLNFEPGVSCIVGPNGCGKSNVIDSVRWCIGEMSWKALRSGSMVDIIFNGTKKRAPLNMAQVNMIFDNTSRKLPVEFNEVTVSRKIFRSGESEYFLNRVPCRLKDIREMFLDTGIGGAGYAIIDQGSVNQMLEASPEQRREMFEEVAGVSKYKAKRDEAVRRLERVDMDIARLSDTLALLEEQIKKLDGEARKARLYQKYREELKESEIILCLENIKSHEEQINKIATELEPIVREKGDLQNAISAAEGETAALDLNLTHKQKQLSEFSEKIATDKYQIGLLEGAIQNCENLVQELQARLKNFASEETLSLSRLGEIEPALNNLKKKLEEITLQLEPAEQEYNKKYEQVSANEQAILQARQEFEKATNNLMGFTHKEMELSGKIALEESAAQHENNNLINLERSLTAQKVQIEEVQKELNEIKTSLENKKQTVETLRQEQTKLEEQRQKLFTQKQELNDKLTSLKTKQAALNTKMQMIQTQGKNNPYWVGTKLVEEGKISGVFGTLRKHIKFDKSVELGVEEAFGKYLDSVICEDENAFKQAAELLNKNGKTRCRFIILNAVPASKGEKGLSSKITCEDKFRPLVDCILGSADIQEGSVNCGFWLSAGALNVKSPEAYWGEEESAKKELKELNKEQEELAKQTLKNIDDLARTEDLLKTARSKFQEEALAQNSLQNNLNNKQRLFSDLEQTSAQIVKNKQEILDRIEKRKANVNVFKEQLTALNNQHEEAKKQHEALRTKRAALEQEEQTLKVEIEKASSKLYEIKIKKNNIELDYKTTAGEQTTLLEAKTKRTEETTQAEARIKTLQEEKLTSQAKLAACRDNLAALETSENKMRGDLNVLKAEYDKKMSSLNKNKTRANELALKAQDLENNLTNHRRQKTAIINTLLESWNTTPQEAQMKCEGKKVDIERVKMMRKRIENMGAVNMTAPEEYDALTQRNDFLKKQIEDLQNAKKDLKSAIAKINATTKENFKYTFEQVRTHFKRIYQILFRGGEAEIKLTDPENLLETGIEIIAQPPGKKLLNISAMSGGEKALTAVSLLFAFFTHSPSPFCILDEADAPLDEANVERFVNLIKEFSAKTQFIVVTHNKRSMEAAQMLYGVTMEESGVSKVLSLNLKEQDAKTKQLVEASSAAK
jgi:Chromosome segregation ATPases